MAKKHFAGFGSVSSGTMRPDDLIPEFAYTLHQLAKRAGRVREFRALLKECESYTPDDAPDIVNDLFDALQEFAPPYFYFGAHPGDGSDYGFWMYEDMQSDFDGLQVSDASEVPRGYSGEVLHVNDHGNMTLYRYVRGRSYEIWGIV